MFFEFETKLFIKSMVDRLLSQRYSPYLLVHDFLLFCSIPARVCAHTITQFCMVFDIPILVYVVQTQATDHLDLFLLIFVYICT